MSQYRDTKNMKPMSFDEAANYLAQHKKTFAAEIKKEADEQQIAYSLPTERAQYLAYGVSILADLSPELVRYFPLNANGRGCLYSKKEIIDLLKFVLVAKINLRSNRSIAKKLGVRWDIIDVLEKVGVRAVQDSILKKKLTGIPVIGGLG